MTMRALALALLLTAACEDAGENAASRSAAAPSGQALARAAALRAPAAREVHEESELADFTYGWPAEASAIPALNARLEADLNKARADTLAYARESRAEFGPEVPFNGHQFSKVWQTMGASERLLSLAAQVNTFSGGAHGNTIYEALLWDRASGRAVEVESLFTDAEAAFASMTQAYCDELNAQRAEKREEALPLEGPEWMVQCRPLGEQIIAPYDSNDDGAFDVMRVLIEPYNSGPYSEGTYELDLAVTDDVRRLLKKEYQPAFAR